MEGRRGSRLRMMWGMGSSVEECGYDIWTLYGGGFRLSYEHLRPANLRVLCEVGTSHPI